MELASDRRLARLLAYYERSAATIRATMKLLQGPDRAAAGLTQGGDRYSNGNGYDPIAARALKLDAARAAKVTAKRAAAPARKQRERDEPKARTRKPGRAPRPNKPTAPRPRTYTTKLAKQRGKTAAILAQFDPSEPRIPTEVKIKPGHAIGSLVRRGYLQPHNGGYIRTPKPFVIEVWKKLTDGRDTPADK